jgi:hypothetical protein
VSPGTNFYTLIPCRVLDTRNPNGPMGGPALVANTDRTFTVAGQCGIPAGAKTLSVNVTVTSSTDAGGLEFFAGGSPAPGTATVGYRAGQTRANNAIVAVGIQGDVSVRCDQAAGSVQMILDVNGYFQ